ncbi:MAG: TolC family protein [Arcobacteraceae bacterium]
MKNNILKLFVLFYISSITLNAEVLTFSKAYELGLDNSNTIQSSNYQNESRKQRVEQVKAELYPQISASLSYSDTRHEYNRLRQYKDYYITEKSTDYNISLSQVIYNPEIMTRIESEKVRVKLSEVDNLIKKQELAQVVLKAYLDVLKSKNKLTLIESYVQYNRFQFDLIEKKFKMNLATKMDYLQAKVDLDTSNLELNKEQGLFKVYKIKLTNIIGKTDLIIPNFNLLQSNYALLKEMQNIVSNKEKYITNLEIQQAQFGIEVTKKDIDSAYSGHLPKLNFDMSYTKFDSTATTPDYENTQRAMVTLRIPLYQGGLVDAKINEAKLNYKAANADYNEVENEIKARHDELLTMFSTSIYSVGLYKETLETTQLYLDSVIMGVDNGLKSIVDVQDAKYKLNEVQYKYIENVYNMMDAYIGLLIVTNNFEELRLLDKVFL